MPIKQTIEIVWHPMTERPPRFARYLVAEANCGFKDGQTLVRYEVNERSFGRRLWSHGQSGTPYAWAEKPKIEVPKQEDIYRFSKKEAMRKDIERQFNRKEFLDLIQDHKSNWIPNSKGGEPNCRRL